MSGKCDKIGFHFRVAWKKSFQIEIVMVQMHIIMFRYLI